MKLTTCQVFEQYDCLIRRIEAWLAPISIRVAGCDDSQVKARLIQRIVECTSENITQTIAKQPRVDYDNEFDRSLKARGLSIEIKTGRVRVLLRRWLWELFGFGAIWVKVLLALLLSLFASKKLPISSFTLFMEDPVTDERNRKRFLAFCKQGPITSLSTAKRLVIYSNQRIKYHMGSEVVYINRLTEIITSFIERRSVFPLLLRHIFSPIQLFIAILKCPLTILLAKEVPLLTVMRFFDSARLIEAMIITTSQFASQPIWMRGIHHQRFQLHMVWYSQNLLPKMYEGDAVRSDLPQARHMRVDTHWVWTSGFRDYLLQLGLRSDIKVVGPILWYLPNSTVRPDESSIGIALFDIIPFLEGRSAFGAAKNYYSFATITGFIVDTLEICDELSTKLGKPIRVLLKHKRKPKRGHHDPNYLCFLKDLLASRSNFIELPEDTNLFDLLKECELSISVPYTSTVYVATALGRPAIYYDSSRELKPQYENNELLYFASGREELKKLTASILRDRAPK